MSLSGAERKLHELWMSRTVEDRLLTVAGMYEGEKEILTRLAPKSYSKKDLQEFSFFHMHGMTIEESINYVPERVP